jgi:hypothetical protein
MSDRDQSEMEITMKKLLTLSCLMLALSSSAFAGDTDPLFINMTSDDNHRANMAITFGTKQHARGHALTIFLNDKGVLVGSKAHAKKFADRQKDLMALYEIEWVTHFIERPSEGTRNPAFRKGSRPC